VKEHVVHDTGQGEERVPQEIYLGICLWEGIWRCGKIYRELRPLGKLIVAVTSSGCQGLKTDIFFLRETQDGYVSTTTASETTRRRI